MRRILLTFALLALAGEASAARTIRYVGGMTAGFAGKTSSTTVTFDLTGGMSEVPEGGDLVLVSYCTGSTADRTLTITNTTPTAYDYLSDLYADDLYDANMRVGYRFMPSTPETQMILSQTFAIEDAGRYTVHVFRGVDPSTPIDVASTTITGIDSRVVNPAAITPSTAGAWIWITGCGAGATATTAYTASHLTGFVSGGTADNVDSVIGSGWYRQWTSGAYDGADFAAGGTSTTDDSWASTTVALRPATLTSAIKPTGGNVISSVGAANVVLAFPTGEDVTSGNHVVVGCATWWGAAGGPYASTDLTKTAGTSTVGTVTLDSQYRTGADPFKEATVFSVPITGSGTLTLTVANAGIDGATCVAQEYSGMDSTTRVQDQNTGTGTSTTPATGTVAGTGEVLFFGAHINASAVDAAITAGADFDGVGEQENGASWTSGAFEERIVTTDTTDAADWTLASSVQWAAAMGVYQDTTGGGPTCAQSIALMGVGCR
jgi:hypothetical protein